MPTVEHIVAYSDLVDFQTSHDESILLSVANAENFAGITFDALNPTLNIRLHAKFWQEREPEENESEGFSDNSVVKLMGSVKSQKLLQVEPVPFYMHRKIKLALQCNIITVDELLWEKEENYEGSKVMDERYPFSKGEAWLTLKDDSYFVNVFGE